MIRRHFPEFPGTPSYLSGSTDEEAEEVAFVSEDEEGNVVLVSKKEKEVIILSSDSDQSPDAEGDDDEGEEFRELSTDDGICRILQLGYCLAINPSIVRVRNEATPQAIVPSCLEYTFCIIPLFRQNWDVGPT